MKRTTISLDDGLAFALEREARRRGVSVSEVTRAALKEHLGFDRKRRIGFAAIGRSTDGRSVADGGDERMLAELMDERTAGKLGARRDR